MSCSWYGLTKCLQGNTLFFMTGPRCVCLVSWKENSRKHNNHGVYITLLKVCLEGEISKQSALRSLGEGNLPNGDMIPWTVSQQFQDAEFPSLSGARIVRIAVHPNLIRVIFCYLKHVGRGEEEREDMIVSLYPDLGSEDCYLLFERYVGLYQFEGLEDL